MYDGLNRKWRTDPPLSTRRRDPPIVMRRRDPPPPMGMYDGLNRRTSLYDIARRAAERRDEWARRDASRRRYDGFVDRRRDPIPPVTMYRRRADTLGALDRLRRKW